MLRPCSRWKKTHQVPFNLPAWLQLMSVITCCVGVQRMASVERQCDYTRANPTFSLHQRLDHLAPFSRTGVHSSSGGCSLISLGLPTHCVLSPEPT